jgi:uncharacterized protein DUF6776
MKSRIYMAGIGPRHGLQAATVVAMLVGAYLIFEFGRIQANFNIVDAISEQRLLQGKIDGLGDQIMQLKQEIARLETNRIIDAEAYKVVDTNLTDLQRKIQEQQNAIAFYRGIVSPKDGGRGLRVADLKLTRGKDERHFNLRLVLVQVMQHDRSVKGQVDFSVEGAQNGVATTYTLGQLSPENGSNSWPFAFRYFQDFDRVLVIPDGFTPETIIVEVISNTRSIANVKESFDWLAGQS